MARVGLRITNVRTVNVEFWEEHAGSLKRRRGKSLLFKRNRRQLCGRYLASDNIVYSPGNEGPSERSNVALTK